MMNEKKEATLPFRHYIVGNGKGGSLITSHPVSQEVLDVVANKFVVRDDDLFLVTYPKAGTSWMRQIIHLLTNHGEQGDRILDEFIPYIEGTQKRTIANPSAYVEMLEGNQSRRYLASHLPYTLMPGVKSGKARYLYLARNPKDCAVSLYHFMLDLDGVEAVGTWEQFLSLYLEGQVYYGLVFDHLLEWWQASQQSDHILFLKYEDLQEELACTLQIIARFIDIPLDAVLFNSILAQSSFTSMKGNPKANLNWISEKHLRKGMVGDWRNHFTVEQNEIFDAYCQAKWKDTGLDLEFMPYLAW